jgi:hypothetical protein
MVTGAPGSGKSSLIASMVRAATRGSTALRPWKATDPAATGPTGALPVTEIMLSAPTGRLLRVRFIESERSDQMPGSRQSSDDLDAIVMVIDPTQLAGIGETFPQLTTGGHKGQIDAARALLALKSTWSRSGGARSVIWVAISKPDLLRLSIDPHLVTFPVAIGPGWYRQMSQMGPQDRQRLAERLGMGLLASPDDGNWGGGNPWLIHCRPTEPSTEFGAAQLLSNILNRLT